MEHHLSRIDLGTDKRFFQQLCARCSCGHLTDVVHDLNSLSDVEDHHVRQAKRESLGLGPKRPALKTTLKHYEKMAAHPASTVTERTQWATLADEVRQRIEQTTVDHTISQGSLLDLLEES